MLRRAPMKPNTTSYSFIHRQTDNTVPSQCKSICPRRASCKTPNPSLRGWGLRRVQPEHPTNSCERELRDCDILSFLRVINVTVLAYSSKFCLTLVQRRYRIYLFKKYIANCILLLKSEIHVFIHGTRSLTGLIRKVHK